MNIEVLTVRPTQPITSVHSTPDSVNADLVRECLEKVISSTAFARARRLRRLLRHIADATLRGANRRELSEMAIGLTVFEREPASYDPGLDPIVRVQARRLRHKLADYYTAEGAADPVRISVPAGAYVASFESRGATDGLPAGEEAVSHAGLAECHSVMRRGLVVTPLMSLDLEPADREFGARVNAALIERLQTCRQPGMRLMFCDERLPDYRLLGGVDPCVLEGSIRRVGNQARACLRLSRCDDGRVIWTGQFEQPRQGFGGHEALCAAITGAIDALCRLLH